MHKMFAHQINLQAEEWLHPRQGSQSCTGDAGLQVKSGFYGPLSLISSVRWPLVPISHNVEIE